MSLLDDYFKEYNVMVPTETEDGEGGQVCSWAPGTVVKMALDAPNSTEKTIANALKAAVTQSAIFPQSEQISRDMYLRLKDNSSVVFRVVSDPDIDRTPARSLLNIKRADVVRTELPT